ncbi:MAG: DUF2235 domain-containing protein [bacterium]
MPKNIVLCSDGTGNSALKGRGTNVFKIYEAVDLNGHKFKKTLKNQVAFYDDGVGTESLKFLKMLGGAFGWGLSRNVKDLYTALARCYEPGDNIFVFGFSRGAFTVRQLAGFILGCGIIDKSHWKTDSELKKLVGKAFRTYRKRYRTWLGERLKKLFSSDRQAREDFRKTYGVQHKTHAPDGKVRIRFIGVWDTVAAVGLPFDHLANFINNVIYLFKFPDRRLSSRVDKACHALAIDDERHSFHPEVWDEKKEKQTDRIEQVWFSGVHSNVGGGYPKQGMSLVALDWMMAQAEEQGLRFILTVRTSYHELQNVNDKLYNSRSGIGVYYRYKVRDIGKMCQDNHMSQNIHVSACHRIAAGTEGYAPVNLSRDLQIVATNKPPAAGEDSPALTKLASKMSKAFSNESPWSKAQKWMTIRRYSHYGFIVLSLAIFWFSKQQPSGSSADEASWFDGVLKVAGFIVSDNIANNFLKPIFTRPEIGFPLLGLLVLFYMLGASAKGRINKIFSTFWRKTLL